MALLDIWGKIGEIVLPTSVQTGGKGLSPTFNPQQSDQAIASLETNNHLRDLLTERVNNEDDDLIATLMQYDPDVGAAVSAYLTVSNTPMRFIAKTPENEIDGDAINKISQLITQISYPVDYQAGYTPDRTLKKRNQDLRYMLLKRGSISIEMILDDQYGVSDVRTIDTKTLKWYEKTNGFLKPVQSSNNTDVDLDIPTFYYASHRQDPGTAYTKSPFIAVINTVYARLQVINDLYNIMQVTGYPRMDVKVLEESLVRHMPEDEKRDTKKRNNYVTQQISRITSSFANVRADQPLVHTDSVEIDTLNTPNGSVGIDIRPVIEVLNSQNQAALKSVATVLGRGESGVNTASVEAQIFSMQASEINDPLASVWSNLFTYALRISGSTSYVEVYFEKPEMRPPNELEPAMVQRQARLRKDLSSGLITDDEYHWQMYNRPRPSDSPLLSGTGFEDTKSSNSTDEATNATTNTPQKDQPNSRQRSQTKASDKSAKSNAVK